MKDCKSLHHTKWDCKYHVVYIAKRLKERYLESYENILGMYFMDWQNKGNQA